MATKGLERVVKDGSIAALIESGKKLSERAGGLIANTGEVGDGEEFEGSGGRGHARAASNRVSASATSAGSRRPNLAWVGRRLPTRTDRPWRAAAKAGSSE